MVLILAAHDAGLAAGFAGPQDVPALKAVLGLPDEFHPIGVIPVGRPLPDTRSPSLKRDWVPFEEFARGERWSRRYVGAANGSPVSPGWRPIAAPGASRRRR